jgi:hypothetical protein
MSKKDERVFYTYAFLRSKDSASGKKGSPYYIGKGSGNRAWSKTRKIRLPVDKKCIVFLRSNLTEREAFGWEIFYIAWYGRIDNGTGILRNLTDGGEGASGFNMPKEAVERIAVLNRGLKRSAEAKAKMSAAKMGERHFRWGQKMPQETKERMSESAKLRNQRPEYIDNLSRSKEVYEYELTDPEGHRHITRSLRRFCSDKNLHDTAFRRILRGKQKEHKGWTIKLLRKLK